MKAVFIESHGGPEVLRHGWPHPDRLKPLQYLNVFGCIVQRWLLLHIILSSASLIQSRARNRG